jgi:hypothetical protein
VKISIVDLKKAIQWIETNTNEALVSITDMSTFLMIECKDKYEEQVDIRLFSGNLMLPKIRKETVLK